MMLLRRASSLAVAAGCCAASSAARCDDKKKKAEPKSVGELVATLATRQRQVFLSGTIDDEVAKTVIAQLLYLEADAPGVPIDLHINSSGGKVYAGFAILGVMRSLRSPVHTTCLGHCESMAAVVRAAPLNHAHAVAASPQHGRSASESCSSDPPLRCRSCSRAASRALAACCRTRA